MDESDRAKRPRLGRREVLTLGAAASAGIGATLYLARRPRPATRLELTSVVRAVLDDPGSPRVGAAGGDLTIVVFTDYQCPICRADAPGFARLLADDPGVTMIFKDWAIRGEISQACARAALAAARQGRYAAFHQALMTAPGRLSEARLPALAAAAGVHPARLAADLAAHRAAFDAQLRRHALQAFSLGLKGTPDYIVGRDLHQGGLNPERLAAAVRRARAAGGF